MENREKNTGYIAYLMQDNFHAVIFKYNTENEALEKKAFEKLRIGGHGRPLYIGSNRKTAEFVVNTLEEKGLAKLINYRNDNNYISFIWSNGLPSMIEFNKEYKSEIEQDFKKLKANGEIKEIVYFGPNKEDAEGILLCLLNMGQINPK